MPRPSSRRLRGRQLVLGSRTLESSNKPLSFGVGPAEKMTVAAVAAILRDKGSPRPLSSPVTQEGAVFQLRAEMPKEIGCVYWRMTAEPATSVLTPWYLGINETPPSYYRPGTVETHVSLARHFRPPQTGSQTVGQSQELCLQRGPAREIGRIGVLHRE